MSDPRGDDFSARAFASIATAGFDMSLKISKTRKPSSRGELQFGAVNNHIAAYFAAFEQ